MLTNRASIETKLPTTTFDPRDLAPEYWLKYSPSHGISDKNSRRLLGLVLNGGSNKPTEWYNAGLIKKDFCSKLSELPQLTHQRSIQSGTDGFIKILFNTDDKLPLETVIIPLEKHNMVTICLSSQVGCVMGCVFCATGKMKNRRNLAAWEIVDQFIKARQLVLSQGKKVSGAVFMGMGEPFLNYENVITAAKLLSFPVASAVAGKSITISTVGMLDEIKKFTAERHPFRLSISLGAATDEKRAKLVPVAAKTPIIKVIEAAKEHAKVTNDRIMLSYVCMAGENVFEEDAIALAQLIGDTPVRLDLIEVNDLSGKYCRPSEQEFNQFRDALTKHLKQPVVRRYSGGLDIAAACGTLAGTTPPDLHPPPK